MTRPTAHLEVDQLFLRGICLIVKGKRPSHPGLQRSTATATVAKFPPRPDPSTLSESIPLFSLDAIGTDSGLRARLKGALAASCCSGDRRSGSPRRTAD